MNGLQYCRQKPASCKRRAESLGVFPSARIGDVAYIEYVPAEEWKLDPDNILRIHGINPPVLKAHLALYRAVMHGASPLSRAQREMMAVAVSALNECHY